MFKVKNRNTKKWFEKVERISPPFSRVSIVDFEPINVIWVSQLQTY